MRCCSEPSSSASASLPLGAETWLMEEALERVRRWLGDERDVVVVLAERVRFVVGLFMLAEELFAAETSPSSRVLGLLGRLRLVEGGILGNRMCGV